LSAHFVGIGQAGRGKVPQTRAWQARDAPLMSTHQDNRALSILHGPPLADEPGLGELTLPGFIRQVTDRFADKEALVHRRDDGSIERWSYQELWEHAFQVAQALVACGLGKGERVAILMTNRAEFLSALFGTALAGGVATPLSTFATADELDYLISASACSVLLLERHVLKKDFASTLVALEPAIAAADPGKLESLRYPFLRHIAAVDAASTEGSIEAWQFFLARGKATPASQVEARAALVSPADPGVLFFSSGSTAKPKGIVSAHRGVAIQLWRMGPQQGLDEDVRSWTANGFFWSGNFAMIVGGTLGKGGTLVLQRTFQPEEALDLMEREKATFLFAWPHQWAQLIAAENWRRVDLSALKYVDVDSPIAEHPTIHSSWIEPRHCYGNTETFTISTALAANTPREVGGLSHGRPLPGNSIKIVEPLTGKVVPVGAQGEIAVKGPTLMLGYLGIPLDESLDEEGYFRTGDGGHIDEAGLLYFEGRLNDIIKTGGANVSPVEIDEVIRECPGVKVAQTVGVPHDTLGEMVVTCIVASNDAGLNEEAVRAFAREKLASYKVPRRVLFFTESDMQLTGSSKVKTSDLRKLASDRLETEAAT
jgi:acyl-CoA synthetase (AMP-forming)/AMP-acid ligase II